MSSTVKQTKLPRQRYYRTTGFEGDKFLRHACKLSFKYFVKTFWEHVPGAGQLIWNWHMDVICDELQAVAERVFANQPKEYDLILNVPPGTSKSTLGSILFQAWTWCRLPSARHICGSHSADLALDLATKSRDVMKSDLYKTLFPEVEMVEEQDTKAYYRNTSGGDRYTCTVGGRSPIGFHGVFQTIDDALDPKEVLSETALQTAKDFFTNHLPGRKTNRDVAVTILIMQRLGVGDSTDVMLDIAKREGASPVRLICLPAELTEDVQPSELKERYVDGLLDPLRLPKHVLDRERASMGEHTYQTQFLQRASIPGGSKFRIEWFNKRKKAAPYNCKRIRFWDRASSETETACATAGALLAMDETGHIYVENVVYGKWEPVERNKKIKATALADRARYGPKHEPRIYVEREGGSTNKDAWIAIARILAGFPIREDRPTGNKDVRSDPWAWELAAENVTIIDNGQSDGTGQPTWDINAFIQEHINFRPSPGRKLGRNKDRVDACSGAYNLLKGTKAAGGLRTYNIGRSKNGPPVKIFAGTRSQLAEADIVNPSILISIQDPLPDPLASLKQGELFSSPELPPHALRLVASCVIHFADLDSYDRETNEEWDTPDPDTGKKPSELAITKDIAKKMWLTILKKYQTPPQIIVIQGEEDGRHASVAMAVCDSLNFKRDQALFTLDSDDSSSSGSILKGDIPNKYVYDVVRDAKRLIVT
jgi:hypothetical protein